MNEHKVLSNLGTVGNDELLEQRDKLWDWFAPSGVSLDKQSALNRDKLAHLLEIERELTLREGV